MASYQTKTNDGTEIKISGIEVPEMPSLDTATPPSNKEIDSNLSQAKSKLEDQKSNLNEHGKQIVGSAQKVLDSTSNLINEKNKEERFQKVFLFSKGAAEGGPSEGLNEAVQNLMRQATGIGSKVSNDATDLSSYIRETVYNLTTSSELREIGVEFLSLLQSLIQELQGQIEDAKHDVKTKEDPIASQASKMEKKAENLKQRAYAQTEDEQIERIRERLTGFLSRVSQQQEYQMVVNNFFKYSEQIYNSLFEAKEEMKNTKEADDLKTLMNDAWEILGDFAGRDLVMKFRKDLLKTLEQIKNDNELRAWIQESKNLMVTLMENPDEGARKQHDEKIDELIRRGRKLTEKYRKDLDGLYNDANRMLTRIKNDPVITDFQLKLEELGRNLTLNNRGQPDLFVMEESMIQIKNLMVEMFRGMLVDIPIKRIDIRNEDMDVTLTDISIQGTGLVPDTVHVKMGSYSNFKLQKSPDAQTHFRLRLRIDGIKPEFKGVKFAYNKKTFPQISDNGVTDVIFEGNGLSAEALVQLQVESGEFARAKAVSKVTLDHIKLNIDREKTKHDIIDTIMAPLASGQVRSRIEKGINDWMRSRLNELMNQLNDWFATKPFENLKKRANEALHEAQERTQKSIEQSSQKMEELKNQASQKIDEAKEKLSSEKDKLSSDKQQVSSTDQDRIREAQKVIEDNANRHPIKDPASPRTDPQIDSASGKLNQQQIHLPQGAIPQQ